MTSLVYSSLRLSLSLSQSIVLTGIYSAIPYILLALLILTGGLIADLMRRFIPTGIVRRIMTSSGKTMFDISSLQLSLFEPLQRSALLPLSCSYAATLAPLS